MAAALSGRGSLIKRGAGALIQAGNSVAFTGSTVVSAGSLIVGADAARAAAVLGGSVSVQDGRDWADMARSVPAPVRS